MIYGHPKGSKLWAQCLDQNLKHLGFKQFEKDQCVYGKWVNWDLKNLQSDSHFILVLVHSDDLIVISNQMEIMLLISERITSIPLRRRRPRNSYIILRRGSQHHWIENQLINGILLAKNHGKIRDNWTRYIWQTSKNQSRQKRLSSNPRCKTKANISTDNWLNYFRIQPLPTRSRVSSWSTHESYACTKRTTSKATNESSEIHKWNNEMGIKFLPRYEHEIWNEIHLLRLLRFISCWWWWLIQKLAQENFSFSYAKGKDAYVLNPDKALM